MVWENRPIEEILKEKLLNPENGCDFSRTEGENLWASYTEARKHLVEEILPEIKAIEPEMTDHGPEHIANVLNNYNFLLKGDMNLHPKELLFICLLAFFHDVGNIYGREDHYNKDKISKIYDEVRKNENKYNEERNLVILAASAHSGTASDDSSDTIKELDPENQGYYNFGISLRKFAAFLRFADELAEGPQRTSTFRLKNGKYKKENQIYHEYANCTKIFIDRNIGRIALTYNINIKTKNGIILKKTQAELTKLLKFIYKRIIKLDNERKYNKFYCDLLSPFKETTAKINIYKDSQLQDLGLDQIILNDLTLPSDSKVSISSLYSEYNTNRILNVLNT